MTGFPRPAPPRPVRLSPDPDALAKAKAFVRSIVIDQWHQRMDDAEIERIARRVLAALP